MGFSGGSVKNPGFDPWDGKILWRKAWQLTPVFLPGESSWTEEPGGLQSMGLQRVGHGLATKHCTVSYIYPSVLWSDINIAITSHYWHEACFFIILPSTISFGFECMCMSCAFVFKCVCCRGLYVDFLFLIQYDHLFFFDHLYLDEYI